jgi:hypothetical protein
MSWLCSQVLVEAYSEENSWDGEPSVQLSVICTPHPFWYRDKTTDISRLFRFGLTFARLTEPDGEDLLTWFREDFLARTYLPPERGLESKEAEADCGEKWRGLSVKFDRDSCGWKTVHCLFQEDLDWSSLTLPNWGMMQDGELWERTTPGLPIAESGSGSGENWPTPCATDHKGSGKTGQLRDRLDYAVERGGTKTRQTWPTPQATAGTYDLNWESTDGRVKPNKLGWAVRTLWPTPRAGKTSDENEESWKARNADGQVSTPPLTLAVKMWATPTASTGGPEPEGQTGRKLTTQVSGQLNPDWVEWLMGWPIGWTACGRLETDRFRQWCGLHGKR